MTSDQPWWLTMPPAELAARILPCFSDQPHEEHAAISNIVKWCKTGSYGRQGPIGLILRMGLEPFEDPDMRAIAEAIQVLEHAGLVLRGFLEPNFLGLTRLGQHAFQTNTVRQHLGFGDAPPTA
jgi:hypothetical protein